MKKARLRCYVSAPSLYDTQTLRVVLAGLDVATDRVEELPPPGESPSSVFLNRMLRADFVCGIVTGAAHRMANVLLELGVAVGADKPLFLIAESTEQLPFLLQSYPRVVGAANDAEALKFHLSTFLRALSQRKKKAPPPAYQRLGEATLQHSEEVRLGKMSPAASRAGKRREDADAIRSRIRGGQTELELTQAIADALKIAGTDVASNLHLSDGGRPDIVAWLPNTTTDLGPAILVEVKRSLPPTRGRHEAAEQVERYMNAAGIRTAILVAPDGPAEIEVERLSTGYLFVLSVETLLDVIARGMLTQSLKETRNRFVHLRP